MRRRRWVLILLLLGIAAAFWMLLPFTHSSIRKTITWPDGSQWTLKAVTYGDPTVYPGDKWRVNVGRLLPARLASKLRPPWTRFATGTSNLSFWVECRGKGDSLALLLMDDEGFSSQTISKGRRILPNGTRLEVWDCEMFPRRGKTVTLRLLSKSTITWDDFVVKNPLYRAYLTWTPESLPGTRTNEPFEFTLIELTLNQNPARFWESGFPDGVQGIPPAGQGVFRVARQGNPTDELRPVAMEIMDATGNRIAPYCVVRKQGDEFTLFYGRALWPSESAWKLRVEFSAPPAYAATGQLWSIKGLSLYETNLLLNPQCRTNLAGTDLQLVSRLVQDGRGAYSVQVAPLRKDYRLTLLRASDDRGRVAAEGIDLRDRAFRLDLPVNFYADSIDLTFAYHPSRFAEFLSKPRLAASTAGFSSSADSTNKSAR